MSKKLKLFKIGDVILDIKKKLFKIKLNLVDFVAHGINVKMEQCALTVFQ